MFHPREGFSHGIYREYRGGHKKRFNTTQKGVKVLNPFNTKGIQVKPLENDLETRIIIELKKEVDGNSKGISARELTKRLRSYFPGVLVKKKVNRVLYRVLEPKGLVQKSSDPTPLWSLIKDRGDQEEIFGTKDRDEFDKGNLVVIDLGNVHDCLLHCHKLLLSGETNLWVWAYADKAFNGYGVNKNTLEIGKKLEEDFRYKMCVATGNGKQGADIDIVIDLTTKLNQEKNFQKTKRIILATKDKGLAYFRIRAKQRWGVEVIIVRDWEEMREYVA